VLSVARTPPWAPNRRREAVEAVLVGHGGRQSNKEAPAVEELVGMRLVRVREAQLGQRSMAGGAVAAEAGEEWQDGTKRRARAGARAGKGATAGAELVTARLTGIRAAARACGAGVAGDWGRETVWVGRWRRCERERERADGWVQPADGPGEKN
jgi:hypothetical protein